MSMRHPLHPTKKIDDEENDKYRSKTDIHKNLRRIVQVPIETQAIKPVGTLPHATRFYTEKHR
jgi:hypothetical protein